MMVDYVQNEKECQRELGTATKTKRRENQPARDDDDLAGVKGLNKAPLDVDPSHVEASQLLKGSRAKVDITCGT